MSAISGDGVTADSSANDFSYAHIPNDAIGDSEVGENNANIVTSSQQAEEPYRMHSSQFQPAPEPNSGPRRDAKRERSVSEECGTGPEKRMRGNADGETVPMADLAVQHVQEGCVKEGRVEEGCVEDGRVEEEPAWPSAVGLTCDEPVPNAQKRSDGNRTVCLGHTSALAHTFAYPNYGTITKKKKVMPEMTVTIRDTLHVSGLRFHVVDGCFKAFATIDVKIARFLKDILKLFPGQRLLEKLQLRLMVRDRVGDDYSLNPKDPWKSQLRMDVHINVPKRIAINVLRITAQHGITLHQPRLHTFPAFEGPRDISSAEKMDIDSTEEDSPKLIGQDLMDEENDGSDDIANAVERNALNLKRLFASADDLPEAGQPQGVMTSLLPYQKQGLHFLLERERDPFDRDEDTPKGIIQSLNIWETIQHGTKTVYYNKVLGTHQVQLPKPYRGGILADEMGLGKTLTLLSLIVETLGEAKKFACGPHQRHPGGIRPRAKGTLCVVPKTLLESAWKAQIDTHIEHKRLNLFLFYGPLKQKLTTSQLKESLEKADIVLTTYTTLVFDYKTKEKIIDKYYWFRLVLDEAHLIRTQSSQNARICCMVEANRRWAVTGTPLQNSLLDLGSLVKFLRVYPFDDPVEFHNKIAAPFGAGDATVFASLRILVDCIALRRTKEKLQGLPKKVETSMLIPMTGNERKCYEILVEDMSNLVNRKKETGRNFSHYFLTGLMRIRRFCAHKQELLSTDDLKLFKGLVSDYPMEIDDDDEEDEETEEHTILTRQVALDMVQLTRASDCEQCGYCSTRLTLDNEEEESADTRRVYGCMIECLHILCSSCVEEWQKSSKKSVRNPNYVRCALCEEEHRSDTIKLLCAEVNDFLRNQERLESNKRVAKQLGAYTGPSTKVQYLIQQLNHFREWNEEHPDRITKAVVFSYWVDHLNLIEIALGTEGIEFCRLDGKMSQEERHKSIQTFQTESKIIVFLSTIGAGGVGITLTAANHVFIMEPGWNPQAEEQAIDRVHRIGQRQPVRVLRMIAHDTVEVAIRDYAKMKLALANVVLDRNLAKKEDRQGLFQQMERVFKKRPMKNGNAWSGKME